ncbi:MAG: hypothetical protein FJ291_13810 [Planctomycetes bacterium]|nr:hypothetical protein [Planctomycetota bacterium]
MKALALVVVALVSGIASGGAPIVGQTPDPAPGGLQMVVAGDGFVAGKTRFRLWSPEWKAEFAEKDEPARLLAYLGQPEPKLPDKPGAAFVDCQVIRCTNSLAAVEFPQYGPWSGPRQGSYFAVLYAGDDKDGWSAPWAFNRTEAHMLDKDAAAPGDFVRIFGRKLQAMHAPLPIIALVPRAGGKPLPCPTQDIYYQHQHYIGNYSCQFRVPADLPEGSYQVRAHNHTGEAWGWSEPLPLEVRKPGPEPKLIRATALDQKVLDEAGKSAPAVVVLPPGIFTLTETLAIPPGVTLRGSGMHNTILRASERPPFKEGRRAADAMGEHAFSPALKDGRILLCGKTRLALEDMALRGIEGKDYCLLGIANGSKGVSEDITLRHCRFEPHHDPDALAQSRGDINAMVVGRARRLTIEHSEFLRAQSLIFDVTDSRIAFNSFDTEGLDGFDGPFGWGGRVMNLAVEHNRLVGDVCINSSGGAWRLLVAGNSVEKSRGCAYIVGETDVRWRGQARCPDASTIVTPGEDWSTDYSVQRLPVLVVVVTKGKGIGQWREVADAKGDVLRLARPLAVVPDESSRLCVMLGSVACTMVSNLAIDCDSTAGAFYGAGAINCIIEGHQVVRSGPLWVRTTRWKPPDLFNTIANCRLFASEGIELRGTDHDPEDAQAVYQLGTLVARNEILGMRPRHPFNDLAYPARFGDSGIAINGGIRLPAAEGNRIINCEAAIEIGKATVGTLVRRNRMIGIQRCPIVDQGTGSIITGFTDKAGFHDYWPQGLNVLELFKGKP